MKRHLPAALVAAALMLLVTISLPASAQNTSINFATNTPLASGIAFATNTPSIPTPTLTASPTLTPTYTATATATPSETPTLTPTFTPTPNGPFTYPEGVNSLTGLPYPSEEAAARRTIIMKISNYPPIVRPQSGVNAADIVYEYEVEGGVTRFAAFYRSNAPSHVGPVRSGRLFDIQLVTMYQTILGYSGASEPIQRMIIGAPWGWRAITPSRGDNCEEAGYCRFPEEGKAFEHTLYVDIRKVWERATQRNVNTGYPGRGFAFADQPDPNGATARDVTIEWYGQMQARWQWNGDRFVRFTDQQPHMDAADGEQLWADNLVIIEVPHQERPDLFEPESRSASQQINLWGEGRALVLRDGHLYQGYWRRRCRDTPPEATPTPETGIDYGCFTREGDALQLVYGNNQSIMLKPGRTWVTVTRWLNYVTVSDQTPDLMATAQVLRLTPTTTPWPTPTLAGG